MSEGWLGPRERAAVALHRSTRRTAAWKAGRWAAKQAVARLCSGGRDGRIEILAAADGAPEAWSGGSRLPVSVSISHRDGVAIAVAAPAEVDLGCDVELIEPRCAAFAADWLTTSEQRTVKQAPPAERDALITLIWSAKESVLKVTHQGLRLDPRQVEISLSGRTFEGESDGDHIHGWWKRDGRFVITAASKEKRQ